MVANARAIAVTIIHQIEQKQTSLIHLDDLLTKHPLIEQNRRFVYVLCYGVFRHYFTLRKQVEHISTGKSKAKVRILLMVGLYQLGFMNKAKHAVVNETVETAALLNLHYAKHFINACLRKAETVDCQQLNVVLDMPKWLLGKIEKYYKSQAKRVIDNSNQQAPMFLRLNQRHKQTELIETLSAQKIGYEVTRLPYAIRLLKACKVEALPGFNQGAMSVQDLSAQYAAHILQPKSGEFILDACSAPGGKATHLLEMCPDIKLTIMDNNQRRIRQVSENLARLQQTELLVEQLCHDASLPLLGARAFDKILADVPCSATGVIRRHPDIKVLRTPEEVIAITEVQGKILNNLWKYLKQGGQLLYATCSILPEENEKQMITFLEMVQNAKVLDIPLLSDESRLTYGYQLLPQLNQGDGFYYCLLEKAS